MHLRGKHIRRKLAPTSSHLDKPHKEDDSVHASLCKQIDELSYATKREKTFLKEIYASRLDGVWNKQMVESLTSRPSYKPSQRELILSTSERQLAEKQRLDPKKIEANLRRIIPRLLSSVTSHYLTHSLTEKDAITNNESLAEISTIKSELGQQVRRRSMSETPLSYQNRTTKKQSKKINNRNDQVQMHRKKQKYAGRQTQSGNNSIRKNHSHSKSKTPVDSKPTQKKSAQKSSRQAFDQNGKTGRQRRSVTLLETAKITSKKDSKPIFSKTNEGDVKRSSSKASRTTAPLPLQQHSSSQEVNENELLNEIMKEAKNKKKVCFEIGNKIVSIDFSLEELEPQKEDASVQLSSSLLADSFSKYSSVGLSALPGRTMRGVASRTSPLIDKGDDYFLDNIYDMRDHNLNQKMGAGAPETTITLNKSKSTETLKTPSTLDSDRASEEEILEDISTPSPSYSQTSATSISTDERTKCDTSHIKDGNLETFSDKENIKSTLSQKLGEKIVNLILKKGTAIKQCIQGLKKEGATAEKSFINSRTVSDPISSNAKIKHTLTKEELENFVLMVEMEDEQTLLKLLDQLAQKYRDVFHIKQANSSSSREDKTTDDFITNIIELIEHQSNLKNIKQEEEIINTNHIYSSQSEKSSARTVHNIASSNQQHHSKQTADTTPPKEQSDSQTSTNITEFMTEELNAIINKRKARKVVRPSKSRVKPLSSRTDISSDNNFDESRPIRSSWRENIIEIDANVDVEEFIRKRVCERQPIRNHQGHEDLVKYCKSLMRKDPPSKLLGDIEILDDRTHGKDEHGGCNLPNLIINLHHQPTNKSLAERSAASFKDHQPETGQSQPVKSVSTLRASGATVGTVSGRRDVVRSAPNRGNTNSGGEDSRFSGTTYTVGRHQKENSEHDHSPKICSDNGNDRVKEHGAPHQETDKSFSYNSNCDLLQHNASTSLAEILTKKVETAEDEVLLHFTRDLTREMASISPYCATDDGYVLAFVRLAGFYRHLVRYESLVQIMGWVFVSSGIGFDKVLCMKQKLLVEDVAETVMTFGNRGRSHTL